MHGDVRNSGECKELSWKKYETVEGIIDMQWGRSWGGFCEEGNFPGRFILSMIPLSLILRKVNVAYEWGKKEYKISHLLFMDELKLYAKTEDQINTLVRTVHMFSNDIGMEFGMKKCGVLTLKRGKIFRSEGIKLAVGQTMKQVEEEGYTYLGIVEVDNIKEA